MIPKIALMVKVWNEERLLPHMLKYYDTLGVDAIYIFDGGSTDGTIDILTEWTGVGKYLIVQEDPHDEYFSDVHEARLINNAIERIEDDGYDWIVKLDADEIFTTNFSRIIIDEYIREYGDILDCVHMIRLNLLDEDHVAEVNKIDGHRLYPDYTCRVFKTSCHRHDDIVGLDTQIRCLPIQDRNHRNMVLPENFIYIIHLKYLLQNVRPRNTRGAKLEDQDIYDYDDLFIKKRISDHAKRIIPKFLNRFQTQ